MANRKVKVAIFGTIGKSIAVETGATFGATLGSNLLTPDGEIGTPNTVRAWLGLSALPPAGVEDDSGAGIVHHRLLQGLTLGDDHPQYTQWVQDEVITGAWTFENTLTVDIADGEQWQATEDLIFSQVANIIQLPVTSGVVADYVGFQLNGVMVGGADDGARGGIEMRLENTQTAANGDFGSQLGFWEGGFQTGSGRVARYPPNATSGGFRWRHEASADSEGDLVFYTHEATLNGQEVYRHKRSTAQMLFISGSASDPPISFSAQPNSGFYLSGINVAVSVPIQVNAGSDSAPAFSFPSDPDTGMYRGVGIVDSVCFSTGGTERFSIGNTDTSGATAARGIRSTLSFRGPAGSATVPAFTFTGDNNTGMYSVGGDQLGFSIGGTLRVTLTTTELVSTLGFRAPDGSASACGYGFTNDIDIGMFRVGANTLGLGTAGVERLRIDADGAWGLAGANVGTADQVLTSQGSGLPPIWADGGGGGGGGSSLVYVNTSVEAGDTIAGTAAETAFDASYQIPANTLTDGSVVRVRIFGVYGTDAVPPTIRLRLKLDSTTVLDSGAVQAVDVGTAGWMLEAQLVAQTGGATGDLEAQGWAELETVTLSAAQVINLENTAPITVDMTQALDLTLTVEWSASDADNTITLRQMAVWIDEAAVAPTAAAPATATFLTEVDETATLPNSRALLAGSGISLDDSVAGELTIEATGGGGGADGATEYRMIQDFLPLPDVNGSTGWDLLFAGTSATAGGVAGVAGHPGILRFTTGTQNGGRAGVIAQVSATAVATHGIVPGGGAITMDFVFRLITAVPIVTTNDVALRLGIADDIDPGPTDGIFIGSAFDGSTYKAVGTVLVAGAQTQTSSAAGVALALNTWYHGRLVINAGGTAVQYFIDGASLGTLTMTLPAVSMLPFGQYRTLTGAANVSLDLDLIQTVQEFTTPRWT